jgi:hypothetical protein
LVGELTTAARTVGHQAILPNEDACWFCVWLTWRMNSVRVDVPLISWLPRAALRLLEHTSCWIWGLWPTWISVDFCCSRAAPFLTVSLGVLALLTISDVKPASFFDELSFSASRVLSEPRPRSARGKVNEACECKHFWNCCTYSLSKHSTDHD